MNPFQHIVDEAKSWCFGWDFVEIERICFVKENGAGGLWYPPHGDQKRARICLAWDESIGGGWHEVFHSVIYRSPLIKAEPTWGEGWCCAFSEAMREEFSTAPIYEREPLSDFERRYSFAATHLVRRTGYSKFLLKNVWQRFNSNPEGFSEFVGYNPATGNLCLKNTL